jgi:hypothetical protein
VRRGISDFHCCLICVGRQRFTEFLKSKQHHEFYVLISQAARSNTISTDFAKAEKNILQCERFLTLMVFYRDGKLKRVK